MTWCAVIGHPITHSLSPVIHAAAYDSLGLDWEYKSFDVSKEDAVPFLQALDPQCRGLSVTMPNKQVIIPALDHVDGLAKALGSVNTVVSISGALTGFNTDVHGVVAALNEIGADTSKPKRAVIIGGGATASSVIAAMTQMGIADISVVARRHGGPGSAVFAAMTLDLEVRAIPWNATKAVHEHLALADLIVSTVPAGVADCWADTPLKPGVFFLDVVYDQWPTRLAGHVVSRGGLVAPGWRMLLHQGHAQVKLFTSYEADLQIMSAALDQALEQRGIVNERG
ncbi:MAG: shikimate dehydrogenase [Actinomycetaceae bacterium]|nr:shikimate dehydrogenase [Actinomycetaceae bacterium]